MQQVEEILSQSIHQYTEILEFLQIMNKEIGAALPEELLVLGESLAQLQSHATKTDQVLLMELNKHSALAETMQPLIYKREQIMKEILFLNGRITEKASGVKSLIAHEMVKLRTGLSALNGYKQQQYGQGRIVDRTS